ncbi:MAG TPA: DUF4129 domain-containing protein [Candidatus Limnocylindrales bacterium]|nr:DUF4129 domain-containing protein [Candidatus Limnocylindrales bacterium]
MLIGVSLLVGLVALSSAARPAGDAAPASRLLVRLPEPVIAVAVTSVALAVLLFYVLSVLRERRRRRELDEPIEPEAPRLQLPWWARQLVAVFVMIPYLLAAYVILKDGALPELLSRLAAQLARLSSLTEPPAPGTEELVTSSPMFTGTLTVLILAVALGSLAVVLWAFFGERIIEWWRGPEPSSPPAALVAAVDESLDDLRLEPDVRVAIIKCYRRFEVALALSRLPRAPWQTPVEFMREALDRLPLPPGAVRALTGLFERSRFSNEPLGPPDGHAAWDSLMEIKATLAEVDLRAVAR